MKKLRDYTGKPLRDCTILELYNAALALTQEACADRGYNSGKKKVYYISAEFLIGKLLRPASSTALRHWDFPRTA